MAKDKSHYFFHICSLILYTDVVTVYDGLFDLMTGQCEFNCTRLCYLLAPLLLLSYIYTACTSLNRFCDPRLINSRLLNYIINKCSGYLSYTTNMSIFCPRQLTLPEQGPNCPSLKMSPVLKIYSFFFFKQHCVTSILQQCWIIFYQFTLHSHSLKFE